MKDAVSCSSLTEAELDSQLLGYTCNICTISKKVFSFYDITGVTTQETENRTNRG